MMPRLLMLPVVLLSACGVDPTLGIGVTVNGAAVEVTGEADSAVVALSLDVDVSVGDFADGERMFFIPRAELFVNMMLVAQMNLDRPADFEDRVAPGRETQLDIVGATPAGAFPNARAQICGQQATVLVHWEDRSAMEFGVALPSPTLIDSVVCD